MGEFKESNTVQRAIKTETTKEQNQKEWASSAGLCQRYKPQHPHHHEKVSPYKRKRKKRPLRIRHCEGTVMSVNMLSQLAEALWSDLGL